MLVNNVTNLFTTFLGLSLNFKKMAVSRRETAINMNDNPLPVNFTLSEAAKAEIDRLRSIWPQLANEEPGYLSIAWGEVYVDNGGSPASCS